MSRLRKEGALALPELKYVCNAAYAKTLARASILGEKELWSANVIYEMKKVGMDAALHPQSDIKEMRALRIPEYVLSLIEAWHTLQKKLEPKWSKTLTVQNHRKQPLTVQN